jgi:PTS system mannose-specific IIA component
MIGMVLVTHGRLATEFRAALEHVVGPQKQVETVTIMPEDDMEQRRKDIIAAIQAVEGGSGVILLTDMFGGTPSNLAISVMEGSRVDVVAGLNLPMLIKLASVRDQSKPGAGLRCTIASEPLRLSSVLTHGANPRDQGNSHEQGNYCDRRCRTSGQRLRDGRVRQPQ